MINLPAPPRTFTSRQIVCVSCQEQFTVAEAFIEANQQEGRLNRAQNPWRLPPDHHPDTTLRFQEARARRSVIPPTRAEPNPHSLLPYGEERNDTYVNCPRCGADNRNWIQILNLRTPAALRIPFLSRFDHWLRRFSVAVTGYIAAFVLAIIAFWVSFPDSIDPAYIFYYSVPLTIAVFLAGYMPTSYITQQWRQLREHINSRGFVQPQSISDRLSPPQKTILTITLVFLFIIPFILYILVPWAFSFAFFLLGPSDLDRTQTINEMIEDLEGIVADESNAEASGLAENALANLRDFVATAESTVGAQEESEEAIAERALDVDEDFLKSWVWFVGTSSLIAIFFSMITVHKYVATVNSQVPRPIFHSIAHMTRVVAWEARQALEIRGDMEHIQWMDVRRNARGGIDLVGLHRDLPDFDATGLPVSDRVRAQRYHVSTNKWGRIESATISDVRATSAMGSPGFVVDRNMPQFVRVPDHSQR